MDDVSERLALGTVYALQWCAAALLTGIMYEALWRL